MVKVPGSLHFWGSFRWSTTDTFSPILTFSSPLSLRLFVQSSLRNFAYIGTCLIMSSKGMYTWTLWKVSRISFSLSSFLDLENWLGNDKAGITGCTSVLSIFLGGSPTSIGEVASSTISGRSLFLLSSILSSATLLWTSSNCLPHLSVIALTFSFGFITIWEGSFPDPSASNLPIVLANWLNLVSKFLMVVLVSCWNWRVLEARVFPISSNNGLKLCWGL